MAPQNKKALRTFLCTENQKFITYFYKRLSDVYLKSRPFNNYITMKAVHIVSFILLVVGGLNWGLTALGYNLVSMLVGQWPMLEKAVYLLVGVAAIFEVVTHKTNCQECTA